MATFIRLSSILALCFTLAGCGINNIPRFDEEVTAAWSNVENQYKRRADLVPNLVNVVKGYAEHEREVLNELVEARAKVGSVNLDANTLSNPAAFKAFQEAQDQLGSALSRLLVTVERYPDLKANQNFLTLQSQLEGAENRIAVARKDYITAVKLYNSELRTFPGRIWHSILYSELEPKEAFTAPASVQEVPNVEF
ncbi:LemA family protein [bacterium]|nr:LemA family protein [bacterium]